MTAELVSAISLYGPKPEPLRDLLATIQGTAAAHLGAAFAGKVEREATPARADVEHPLSRAYLQLGRYVSLLVELGAVKVVAAVIEVGAGILTVLVEEQLVQLVRQVIMVGCVLPGARYRIVLTQPT